MIFFKKNRPYPLNDEQLGTRNFQQLPWPLAAGLGIIAC
jgi:hypothetical protein